MNTKYELKALKLSRNTDRRREPRRTYAGYIFFATRNGVCEGILKNFSRTGLYIESTAQVAVGDPITIALPKFDDKRPGEIVWHNADGFGVRLGSGTVAQQQPANLYQRISSSVFRLFRDHT